MKTAFIVLLVLLSMFASGYWNFKTEYQALPVVKEYVGEQGLAGVARTFLIKSPSVEGRVPLGQINASVILIAYLDESQASRMFIEKDLPRLQEAFINDGGLIFYQKPYVSMADYSKKEGGYLQARRFYCAQKNDSEDFLALTNELLGGPSQKDLQDCLSTKEPSELKEDVIEAHSFGKRGISPKLHLSIKGSDTTIIDAISYQRLNKKIRAYQIRVGN